MFLSSIHSLRSYSFNFYAKWILGHLTNPLRCFLSVKIWQTINDSNTQQAPPELRKHFKNVNCKLWYSKTRKWKLIRHMAGGDLFFLKPFSFFFYGTRCCFFASFLLTFCSEVNRSDLWCVFTGSDTGCGRWSDPDRKFQF